MMKAEIAELPTGWIAAFATAAALALLVGTAAQRPTASEARAECRLVADAARQMNLHRLSARVGDGMADAPINCADVFVAAGLELDPDPLPPNVAFRRPRLSKDGCPIHELNIVGGVIFGSGSRIQMTRRGGVCVVSSGETTWIS